MTLEQALQTALDHHRNGRAAQAEGLYRQVIAQSPQHADALHLLGLLRLDAGDLAVGLELIGRAVEANPAVSLFRLSLMRALVQVGRPDQAIVVAQETIKLKPDFIEGHTALAQLERQRGNHAAAEASARAALVHKPDFAPAWHELGIALHQAGRREEAREAYEKTLSLQPDFVEAINNLAVLQRESGDAELSRTTCEQALALRPNSASALMNLGNALFDLHRPDEAIAVFDRVLALPGGNKSQAHLHKALTLLVQGRLAEGWAEYEHRASMLETEISRQVSTLPRWDGSPLDGKTILLWAEQGFGDTILFARYAQIVAEKFGGRVLIACQKPMRTLMESVPGVSGYALWEEIGAVNVQCPLISVPHVTKSTRTIDQIPVDVPYLVPNSDRAVYWRNRIGERAGKLHVGFVWASNPATADGAKRSCPPEMLRELIDLPDVRGFSLQKDFGAEAAKTLGLTDWTSELHDFAETAALVDQMDLIITIDSAVCHLAGALGKTVWTLLPRAGSWQWFLDRDDSPWYPTMRLFRQEHAGDWSAPLAQVREALSRMSADVRV